MSNPRDIKISDFKYTLPEAAIAKYPLEKRDESKLLVYRENQITTSQFKNVDQYIPNNALLVYNNTKVINARLLFKKESGTTIEIFCLEPISPSVYEMALNAKTEVTWRCIIGNLKKWKEGIIEKTILLDNKSVKLKATYLQKVEDDHLIRFNWDGNIPFSTIIETAGVLPIPPYLKRNTEQSDSQSYQTVYSKIEGSVAAPTAGLHFTAEVLERIRNKGIETGEVTLHVGAGTFLPVKSETMDNHAMHSEVIEISKSLIELLLKHVGNVIAVGTTSVRTLESIYWIGYNLINHKNASLQNITVDQWIAYEKHNETSETDSLQAILEVMTSENIQKFVAQTKIIIAPGYRFRIIAGIITNFHQPGSTLLLLVSALVGDKWKDIYEYALKNNYRFLSYGDSSILFPSI